jgi:hypothetical protein
VIIEHDDEDHPDDEAVAFDAFDQFDCVIREELIERIIDWAVGIRRAAYLAGFNDGRRIRS